MNDDFDGLPEAGDVFADGSFYYLFTRCFCVSDTRFIGEDLLTMELIG